MGFISTRSGSFTLHSGQMGTRESAEISSGPRMFTLHSGQMGTPPSYVFQVHKPEFTLHSGQMGTGENHGKKYIPDNVHTPLRSDGNIYIQLFKR